MKRLKELEEKREDEYHALGAASWARSVAQEAFEAEQLRRRSLNKVYLTKLGKQPIFDRFAANQRMVEYLKQFKREKPGHFPSDTKMSLESFMTKEEREKIAKFDKERSLIPFVKDGKILVPNPKKW